MLFCGFTNQNLLYSVNCDIYNLKFKIKRLVFEIYNLYLLWFSFFVFTFVNG